MSKYKYICGMFTDDEDGYTIDCDDMAEEYNKLAKQTEELKAENEKLQQQLKDNTKQVCEKIREKLSLHCDYKDNIGWYMPENKFNLILDQIEKGE